jgi:putative addiction module component (TIGR02574 family)
MTTLRDQILQMSVEDRLELIDEIWRSLDAGIDGLPLTEEQKRELDRRLALLDADPGRTKPWEQIRAELDARP